MADMAGGEREKEEELKNIRGPALATQPTGPPSARRVATAAYDDLRSFSTSCGRRTAVALSRPQRALTVAAVRNHPRKYIDTGSNSITRRPASRSTCTRAADVDDPRAALPIRTFCDPALQPLI